VDAGVFGIALVGSDGAHDRLDPSELRSATDRLAAGGASLVSVGGGAVESSSGPPPGFVPVRLAAHPRRWYELADVVELCSLADVVQNVDVLRRASVGGALFAGGPDVWRRALVERLGDGFRSGDDLWLFGAGLVGRQTARAADAAGVPLSGYLDNDPGLRGALVDGLPVRSPDEVDLRASTVAVCTGAHHGAIISQLHAREVARVLGLSELFFLLDATGEPEGAYLEDLWANRCRYVGLALRLRHGESVRVLCRLIQYRLCLDPSLLEDVASGDQWFVPEVFRPDSGHVFIDGGGFDGDTAADFIRHNGGPGEALHIFEPDPVLLERARIRLDGVQGVHLHAAGLSDRPGTAPFTVTGSMDGCIGDCQGPEIALETIDGAVEDTATMIKLDVEGSELAALEGARGAIEKGRPILAIAAYHRASDLWRIPRWIDDLGLDYELYVRHHTELAFETVVYASPCKD
jgi:FkbM family methyltransferase